jgi:DNA replication initiation complex subunit (GINS family)
MYDELYAAWRLEIENGELGSLPSDFYARVADYLGRIKEENKMMDKKSVKTTLLEHEMANASRMAHELISARYRKLLKMILAGRDVPLDALASEEQKLYSGVLPSAEAHAKFKAGILEGQVVKINVEAAAQSSEPPVVHTRVTLRFLKPVPSIIGADMKSYGPFLVEDVASVPVENAKILVKQGLAKQVELG